MRSCWKSGLIWPSWPIGKTNPPAQPAALPLACDGGNVCMEDSLQLCLTVPNTQHLLSVSMSLNPSSTVFQLCDFREVT